ncbi:hypothetical protein [Granulosicoccus antarcticus]|uniref:Uncharacterized protein n=1 Tax=Granulosicoccus antarcticus IMCC3135 TaxID=1192854 RepID=A0A2Z2NL83_9GAMM|nr:hypothetical protein [Granulosicoccus antarcticus]ASJ72086.1 hypothetical protein IMCC3135_09960 [Granulosicoccus antarcticus IMCC3135]
MKFQQSGRPDDHCRLLNSAVNEDKRPESQQESIQWRKSRCTLAMAFDDQELLFHQQAVGNNG